MKRILCILLCAVMAFGLCACNDQGAYVPTGDALEYEEDYTGPVATRPAGDTEQALTLTYYPDRSLNPLLCTDYTNRALFSLIFQSLFTVDRDYRQEPLLCKSYTMSEDMKTYEFQLENATFGDGSALTANDVVATLTAAMASEVYGGRFLHISEISVSENGGVRITLDTPYENLPLLLDIPILKANQLQSDYPLGTGPYVIDTTAQTPVLRRNTNWWCNAELVITAQAIKLTQAQSPTSIRDEFEFSDLSLVCADPGSDKYADYRCDYELWDCENNIFVYLACNLESEVFSNPVVRSKLPMAIDRETLAADYYRGFARSANLPASPLSPYYSEVLAEKYAYDGGAAFTQALNDASLSGKTVILLANKDDTLRLRVARDIAKKLRELGLDVQMSELSSSKYEAALKKKEYDLYLGQTKLSANMDLTPFFATNGALNFGSMGDLGLYTLCNEAFANYGNYYTLHQKVMDDGRLCPILFRSYAIYATRGLLTGLTPARENVFYYSTGRTMEQARGS